MLVDCVIHPREGKCLFTIDSSYLIYAGVCDDRNSYYVTTAILAYIALLDDSPLNASSAKPLKLYREFLTEITTQPILTTVKKYSSLSHTLLTGVRLYGSDDDDLHQEFRNTPIFREYHEWYERRDPKLFTYINSFLLFLKKMKFIDESFHATALRKWRQIEEDLKQVPAYRADDLHDLREIVHSLCGDLDISVTDLKFGPGHVADLSRFHDTAAKADSLTTIPWKLRSLLSSRRIGYYDGDVPPESVVSDFYDFECVATESMRSDWYYSKTKFVFKDVTTSRTISMERNDVMLFQQAILKAVVRSMERGPMRHFVTLQDQSRNQKFSRFGSETGFCDTIDLSSASDRVSFDLVRSVFPRSWLIPLLATRSSYTLLPTGERIAVKKFAPMGSALCFPIQCIIFTAICLLAYKRFVDASITVGDGVRLDLSTPKKVDKFFHDRMRGVADYSAGYHTQRLTSITVYGDDIICDSRVTDRVFELLSAFGFEVNTTKSFCGGQAVRESCGKYYLAGDDVSPLRFKPSYFGENVNAVAFESLIAFANNCGRYGFLNLRSFIIRFLRYGEYPTIRPGVNGVNLPFTTDPDQFGIFVPRRNSYSSVRFNDDLQYHEELVLVTKRRGRPYASHQLEAYTYFRAQNRPASVVSSGDENFSTNRSRLGDTQYAKRWTPLRS